MSAFDYCSWSVCVCSSQRSLLHDHIMLCRRVCVDCMPVTALKTTGALLYVTRGIEMCLLYYPFAPFQLRVVYLIIQLIAP